MNWSPSLKVICHFMEKKGKQTSSVMGCLLLSATQKKQMTTMERKLRGASSLLCYFSYLDSLLDISCKTLVQTGGVD